MDIIQNYKEIINEKGYFRDIQGFSTTLAQPNMNQNLVMLKDIIQKLKSIIDGIYQSSLPDDMIILLPSETNYQFANKDYNKKILDIDNNTEINTENLHIQVVALINDLKNHINNNNTKIAEIEKFLMPYYAKENIDYQDNKRSVLALIFNNKKSYQNLHILTKTLLKWNKAFQLYTQLLKSDPSGDIEITSIHEGSLDFLFNFDINIAIDLTEIVKYGLIALGGYLTYLKTAKPIIDSYLGNKKLIEMENQRKELLLNNVYEAVAQRIKEQHEDKIKTDTKINKESIDKKIEEVAKIITDHLVGGNNIKLLTSTEATKELSDEIKEKTQLIRNQFKVIDKEELRYLEDKFTMKETDK
jgi:hypothetical protein